jgi:hypothetical protein
MANLSRTTRDHEEIRRWAEERGGKPAHVKSTGSAEDIGILRIDFPGYSGQGSLEPISWDEFFEKFDERGLALVYQEETAGGQKSNFNKLVSADSVAESGKGRSRSRGSRATRAGSRTGAKKGGASSKKAAARASGRSGVRAKTAAKAGSKKASSSRATTKKGAAGRATAAKKSSSKKVSAKKSSGARSAAKRSASRRRR